MTTDDPELLVERQAEGRRLLHELAATREARRAELTTAEGTKQERRAARRERLATGAEGVLVQALGTVLGGWLLLAFAAVTGILQTTDATMTIGITLSVVFGLITAIWIGRTARRTDTEAGWRNDELRYLIERDRIVTAYGLDDDPDPAGEG